MLTDTIGSKQPEFGIWIDMEDADGYKARNGGVNRENCIQICEEYCNQMRARGYKAGIYASLSWFNTILNDSRLTGFDKWVAEWHDPSRPSSYTEPHMIWQYTSSGGVPGIMGNVDKNIAYNKY